MAFFGGPLVDDRLFGVGQVPEGHVRAHAHLARDVLHELPHERAPRGNRALVNSQGFIGHEGRSVDDALDARPLTHRARTARVKCHLLRAEAVEGLCTLRARERRLQGDVARGWDAVPVGAQVGARAREQEAQMVEELRGRAEGGAHVGHAGALAQRERGGHVRNLVDRGLGSLGDAPTRVGRQGLQVTPRSLRVERAQGQGGFARPRHARDCDEFVQGNVDVHVFQVVDAGAAHADDARHVRTQGVPASSGRTASPSRCARADQDTRGGPAAPRCARGPGYRSA